MADLNCVTTARGCESSQKDAAEAVRAEVAVAVASLCGAGAVAGADVTRLVGALGRGVCTPGAVGERTGARNNDSVQAAMMNGGTNSARAMITLRTILDPFE